MIGPYDFDRLRASFATTTKAFAQASAGMTAVGRALSELAVALAPFVRSEEHARGCLCADCHAEGAGAPTWQPRRHHKPDCPDRAIVAPDKCFRCGPSDDTESAGGSSEPEGGAR